MAAYAIIDLEITDMDGMAPYVAAVSDTIAAHGGKYLVRAGQTEVAEDGLGPYPVKVALEFPSMEAGRAWYASPEYQAIPPAPPREREGQFRLGGRGVDGQ